MTDKPKPIKGNAALPQTAHIFNVHNLPPVYNATQRPISMITNYFPPTRPVQSSPLIHDSNSKTSPPLPQSSHATVQTKPIQPSHESNL